MDSCLSILSDNGVDCLLTFCSMTEDELNECGLKKGYVLKCRHVQKQIIKECRQSETQVATSDIETPF